MMSKIKKLFKILGPGFITGASDDDPSGIATYAQTGAQFGYSQSWFALFSIPFMTVIQEMCGRIGLVTGRGLAGVIRENYSKPLLFGAVALLLIANTINIGADLGAMAAVGQLIFGVPFVLWLIGITIFTLVLQIFVPYPRYARLLKYLTLSLFSYVIVVFVVKQDWGQIAWSTLVPFFSTDKAYLLNIVALLGTTISPYLFFWQADEEVEEEIERGDLRTSRRGRPHIARFAIQEMRLDTVIGMVFSNVVAFFIIITTASTLNKNGITNIQTADQAAQALRPLAGDLTYLLFALGILGTGLLAVPILAGSASYAVSESMKWHVGLSKKFNQARGFYGVIILATMVGILVNFTSIQPFQMLYYTAVLNGICAPILMILILVISNNKKIMKDHINGLGSNILGFIIVGIMSLASFALLGSFLW